MNISIPSSTVTSLMAWLLGWMTYRWLLGRPGCPALVHEAISFLLAYTAWLANCPAVPAASLTLPCHWCCPLLQFLHVSSAHTSESMKEKTLQREAFHWDHGCNTRGGSHRVDLPADCLCEPERPACTAQEGVFRPITAFV